MKRLQIKGLLSTLLIIVFLIVAISGIMLHFARTGMILGIPRGVLRDVHTWIGFSMCFLIPVHLLLNRLIYVGELKSLAKRSKKTDRIVCKEHF